MSAGRTGKRFAGASQTPTGAIFVPTPNRVNPVRDQWPLASLPL